MLWCQCHMSRSVESIYHQYTQIHLCSNSSLRQRPQGVLATGYKKTLTSDNGREFAYHKIVSYETGMNFYFANPYSPWERWTNENVNWLLRQFLPKKESFANLTTKTLQSYTKSINSRPRKRYNYRTPEEIFFGRTERLTDLCNLN